MENNLQHEWRQRTNVVWIGFLIYTIASLMTSVTMVITALSENAVYTGYRFNEYGIGPGFTLIGYAVHIVGLVFLRRLLGKDDARRVMYIIIAAIITAAVVFIPPTLGNARNIVQIPAIILYMVGFFNLKHSETFPFRATEGAALLFASYIVSLVGGVVIGFLGVLLLMENLQVVIYAIASLGLVTSVMTLVGWYRIKTADPSDI